MKKQPKPVDQKLPNRTATMTTRGRMTIPRKMLADFGWKTGDKLDFTIDENGAVTVCLLSVTKAQQT